MATLLITPLVGLITDVAIFIALACAQIIEDVQCMSAVMVGLYLRAAHGLVLKQT